MSDLPSSRIRNVVLVGHDNHGSRQLFEGIVSAFPDRSFLLALTQGLFYRKSFIGSLWQLLTRASFRFCLRRFLDMKKHQWSGRTLRAACQTRGFPVVSTRDINSEATLTRIRDFQPDLLVSLYTMHLYRAEILSIPRLGAIGAHPSLLPEYRGLEVFYWALANGEKETGVTVSKLSPKIDLGKIISQERFVLTEDQTVTGLYTEVTNRAERMLCETIARLDKGPVTAEPMKGEGSYFPMPTREAYRRFKKDGRKWS